MEVHITFIGLCLFVPDDDGRRFHVLLPKTSGTHQHYPQLHYAGMGPRMPDLTRRSLDLTGLRSTGGSVPNLGFALNVEDVVDGRIPSGELGSSPGKIVSRIILPLPDSVDPGQLVQWEVQPAVGTARLDPLTHQVTWIIQDGNICDTAWDLHHLPGSAVEALGVPIPDVDGKVRIYVVHLPDHPHPVARDKPAPHARAYYEVVGKSGFDPILKQEPVEPCSGRRPLTGSETAYNCMLGTGSPG